MDNKPINSQPAQLTVELGKMTIDAISSVEPCPGCGNRIRQPILDPVAFRQLEQGRELRARCACGHELLVRKRLVYLHRCRP